MDAASTAFSLASSSSRSTHTFSKRSQWSVSERKSSGSVPLRCLSARRRLRSETTRPVAWYLLTEHFFHAFLSVNLAAVANIVSLKFAGLTNEKGCTFFCSSATYTFDSGGPHFFGRTPAPTMKGMAVTGIVRDRSRGAFARKQVTPL